MQPPRDAKVNELDGAVRGEHDVGGLQIAVDDGWFLRMHVREHIAERDAPAQHPLPFQWPPLGDQLVFEIVATHVLHHEIVLLALDKRLIHLRQRGMIEPAEHEGLAIEVVDRLLALRRTEAGLAHLLHRAIRAVAQRILHQVDGALAALRQETYHHIAIEEVAIRRQQPGRLARSSIAQVQTTAGAEMGARRRLTTTPTTVRERLHEVSRCAGRRCRTHWGRQRRCGQDGRLSRSHCNTAAERAPHFFLRRDHWRAGYAGQGVAVNLATIVRFYNSSGQCWRRGARNLAPAHLMLVASTTAHRYNGWDAAHVVPAPKGAQCAAAAPRSTRSGPVRANGRGVIRSSKWSAVWTNWNASGRHVLLLNWSIT